MSASLYIAIILVIAIIAYMIVQQILNKRAVKELDQNEFHNGIRKAQVIDVREKVDYDYGHINGSRNIPMTMFRQRFQGLRKDQPVYLCDANGNGIASYRAARILKKNGYTDIYMLKGGYKKWTGKIKSKK
ncbi:rhodanese-like domain-containing protein [Staphylococcus aureus]|uniref:rhodanese-like domain-containing protein n=4 Tax=Bacteria TaxID=2 RepID=UPI000F3A91EE|nr:rhodanese-like domain-containing protein [Staphylococcus aureus]RNH77055.1 rhodanese-like domain-containing protein [Staphylococcus aureus]